MRVGLVVYGPLDARSGGYRYDRELVDHLRRSGDAVDVVSLPERSYLGSLRDNLSPSLARRLRDPAFDVLLQDELCHPSLAVTNARLDVPRPVVAIVHHLRASEPLGRVGAAVTERLERRYLSTVDAFVYNSAATRRSVERRVGRRPSVVARPGRGTLGTVEPPRIRERAREAPFRVVCVGAVTPRKGLHTLVSGLARLDADWRLAAVGDRSVDPAYAARVRRLSRRLGVDDRVSLPGRVDDASLASRLAESHLFAMPSAHEGFGIAYLEAMGFGLPVVASTAGGARELVDGENGRLVSPGDPEAVADAVAPLADDRERLAAAGIAARETFSAQPTWEETAAKIRRFVSTLVER